MGEKLTPSETTQFLVPIVDIRNDEMQWTAQPHTLADWFGITINDGVAADIASVSALPFRAYALIWNDWFRDQDMVEKATVPTGDGPDSLLTSYGLGGIIYGLPRFKQHDYFTTARPWPQKPINYVGGILGNMDGPTMPGGRMTFPQGGAPVTGLGLAAGQLTSAGPAATEQTGGRTEDWSGAEDAYNSSTNNFYMRADGTDGFPNVRVLINDIRTANMVQLLMERNARGGTRYAEIVRSHFGVVSPDARLQRPEYLGGGRTNITVHPVAQTSATEAGTVLGELAGIGTAIATGHGFSSSFTEHGFIIGLVSVRADLTYQNGINRMWFRRTMFDFYWPALANLGEQAILNQELYNGPLSATNKAIFGYQERWAEYKYKPNRISGVFRSSYATPIDFWHLAQDFSAPPLLSTAFMISDPPVDRVLQVNTTGSAQFLFDSFFDVRMVRPIPMFSIPGLGPRM